MIQSLKKGLYKLVEGLGFRAEYLIILFKLRKLLSLKSLEEKRIEKFYADLFRNKFPLIFDIGGNVGTRTSVFSSLGDLVVVLEPNKELVAILNSRFRQSNVKVIDKACAATSGLKEFHLADNHLVSTLSTQFIFQKQESGAKNRWVKKSQVETISLDELVTIYGTPDFCKIDVEGYEKEVLSGLNQRIGMISFEFNYPAFESDTLWCLERLSSLGYTSFNFSIGESLKFHFSKWVSIEDISAIFHLKEFPFGACYGDIYAK